MFSQWKDSKRSKRVLILNLSQHLKLTHHLIERVIRDHHVKRMQMINKKSTIQWGELEDSSIVLEVIGVGQSRQSPYV
jgi:hypothetical protein